MPPTREEVMELLETLKGEEPARGVAEEGTKSWTSGTFSHGGGLAGLRTHASSHPEVMRTLCRYVRGLLPEFSFAAVALFQGLKAPLHRDSVNLAGCPNLLTPISHFTGGGLWTDEEGGTVPPQVTLGPRSGEGSWTWHQGLSCLMRANGTRRSLGMVVGAVVQSWPRLFPGISTCFRMLIVKG